MIDDPIIEEVRRAGQAYVDSFHGDLRALMADLQRRTEEARRAGHQVVSLPQRPVEPRHEPEVVAKDDELVPGAPKV